MAEAGVAYARGQQHACADYIAQLQTMLADDRYHIDWLANAHAIMLAYWDSSQDREAIRQWLLSAPPVCGGANHFAQLNARNHARAHLNVLGGAGHRTKQRHRSGGLRDKVVDAEGGVVHAQLICADGDVDRVVQHLPGTQPAA